MPGAPTDRCSSCLAIRVVNEKPHLKACATTSGRANQSGFFSADFQLCTAFIKGLTKQAIPVQVRRRRRLMELGNCRDGLEGLAVLATGHVDTGVGIGEVWTGFKPRWRRGSSGATRQKGRILPVATFARVAETLLQATAVKSSQQPQRGTRADTSIAEYRRVGTVCHDETFMPPSDFGGAWPAAVDLIAARRVPATSGCLMTPSPEGVVRPGTLVEVHRVAQRQVIVGHAEQLVQWHWTFEVVETSLADGTVRQSRGWFSQHPGRPAADRAPTLRHQPPPFWGNVDPSQPSLRA